MTSILDLATRFLDWVIDDRMANHNTVIEKGLRIRGVWDTGQLFVHGEELIPPDWEEREKPWGQLRNPTPKYRWGEEGPANDDAARAILEWFLDDRELEAYLEDFAAEVVADLPQADFETNFNYEYWRNHWLHLHSWGKTAQPSPYYDPDMYGGDYQLSADWGDDGDGGDDGE